VRVLAINYGSSSPRFRLSETRPADEERRLAWETVEGVGGRGTLDFSTDDGTARIHGGASALVAKATAYSREPQDVPKIRVWAL
jgi:hypothetical protein